MKHVTDGSPCWCDPVIEKWDEKTQSWVKVTKAKES
jgi:hypothetical protein